LSFEKVGGLYGVALAMVLGVLLRVTGECDTNPLRNSKPNAINSHLTIELRKFFGESKELS
jgi:hypothetical protein